MSITAPPTIPLITDPSTFATRAQDWVVWQAEQLYPELISVSLVLGLSLSGTSVTSNLIGIGSKSFTVETGKGFLPGQSLVIARTSAPTNRMFGLVTSYNSITGNLVFESQAIEGSGTFTDWTITPTLNAVLTLVQIPDSLITKAKLANEAKTDKIQPITASVAANALTITLNPTTLDFRSGTLGNGSVNTRNVAAAISVVVSSGSTLGTVNAVQNRLAVLAIDNAGTVELAVVNIAGGTNLDETGVISTTAEGGAGAADSATVIYSTTARTNVPYRVVGFVESTQATAGTWVTAPSKIQGIGGQSGISTALNASGNAPMYACRAWVNFNGTGTVAIRGSGNVSSITDNGVGLYTVNYATAMPDSNYAAIGTIQGAGGAYITSVTPYPVSSIQLQSVNTTWSAVDTAAMNFSIIR